MLRFYRRVLLAGAVALSMSAAILLGVQYYYLLAAVDAIETERMLISSMRSAVAFQEVSDERLSRTFDNVLRHLDSSSSVNRSAFEIHRRIQTLFAFSTTCIAAAGMALGVCRNTAKREILT